MRGEYIHGLEMRAKWLHWARNGGPSQSLWNDPAYSRALPAYVHNLDCGDTFFMNKNFCELVDHARKDLPDDLQFEDSWMQSEYGFLWLETPFAVPTPPRFAHLTGKKLPYLTDKFVMRVHAVGWMKLPEKNGGGWYVMTYLNFEDYGQVGFGCWSHFTLRQGDLISERIRKFEEKNTKKAESLDLGDMASHEMRWVYAALHLMAQRMTHHSSVQTDRHTRRRGQRTERPVSSFVRVVSLRRLEEDRERERGGEQVDWHWQWAVRGHWRNQPYKDGVLKQIFIESYIKGPEGRPLKPPSHNIFVAQR